MVNGSYIGSSIDISSALGVLSEDINMAYYAASVGMAISYLLIPRIWPVATTKTIILSVLFMQLILSFLCAHTEMIEFLVFYSFLIGIFKGFSMFEVIVILTPEISKSGTRNEFYAKFFPITLSIGQLSIVLTAELAYQYQWQYMYYFMMALLLLAMLAVVICMAFARKLIRIPLKDIDWISFIMVSICMMGILFVMTYGKTKDWFTSPQISVVTVLTVLTGYIFVCRQLKPDPNRLFLINMSIFRHRNCVVAYLLCFLLMFFASFSSLVSTYVTNILRLSSARANEIYLFMIPGIVLGGFVCYYFFLKNVRMAWYIFLGFLCFTVAIGMLYFKVRPDGLYEDLFLPMVLRGAGMLFLFVSLGIYAVQGLEKYENMTNAFFIISARSGIAPAVGSSVIANWLYLEQKINLTYLVEGIDAQNPVAMSSFQSSLKSALAQGWGSEDAGRIATNTVFSTVQLQANLASVKTTLGWMLIAGIILLFLILLYFSRQKAVRLIKAGNDMTA